MKQYQTVEPFMEPSAILQNFDFDPSEPISHMSDSERGFLCGLIRNHRPKKIVEVGVADGATTAVILECARELGLECVMYSVDISERLFYDKSKKTGYVLDQIKMCARGGAHGLASNTSSSFRGDFAGKIERDWRWN